MPLPRRLRRQAVQASIVAAANAVPAAELSASEPLGEDPTIGQLQAAAREAGGHLEVSVVDDIGVATVEPLTNRPGLVILEGAHCCGFGCSCAPALGPDRSVGESGDEAEKHRLLDLLAVGLAVPRAVVSCSAGCTACEASALRLAGPERIKVFAERELVCWSDGTTVHSPEPPAYDPDGPELTWVDTTGTGTPTGYWIWQVLSGDGRVVAHGKSAEWEHALLDGGRVLADLARPEPA